MIRIEGDRIKTFDSMLTCGSTYKKHTPTHTSTVLHMNVVNGRYSQYVRSNIRRGKTLTAQELCSWIYENEPNDRAIVYRLAFYIRTHTHIHTHRQNTVFDTKLQNENEREFKRMVSAQHIKTLRIE